MKKVSHHCRISIFLWFCFHLPFPQFATFPWIWIFMIFSYANLSVFLCIFHSSNFHSFLFQFSWLYTKTHTHDCLDLILFVFIHLYLAKKKIKTWKIVNFPPLLSFLHEFAFVFQFFDYFYSSKLLDICLYNKWK